MKRDLAPTRLDHMIDIVQLHAVDGRAATAIPFLSLIRSRHPTAVAKGVLKPSCCVILQGVKRMHLAERIFDYGPGEYLVATVDMPASGHIITATENKPYLLLNLELDPREIAAIVLEAKIAIDSEQPVSGAFIGQTDDALQESLYQLVRLLQAPPDEAAFLAVGLKREIIYRMLNGPCGRQLYQNVVLDQQDRGISKAIAWLKDHYDQQIKVEDLAHATNMSVSSLHHRFKAVTNIGPMQYQKQLRLQQARALLLNGEVDATTAAYKVGYESASQFSREYRRLFGAPPMQDIKKLRIAP